MAYVRTPANLTWFSSGLREFRHADASVDRCGHRVGWFMSSGHVDTDVCGCFGGPTLEMPLFFPPYDSLVPYFGRNFLFTQTSWKYFFVFTVLSYIVLLIKIPEVW